LARSAGWFRPWRHTTSFSWCSAATLGDRARRRSPGRSHAGPLGAPD
jgi:hypothetical protein